jgi:hypothetical protein
MDAQSLGRGLGRWLIFQTSTRVPTQKKPGQWLRKLFSAAARALTFSVWLSRSSPPALEVTGDLDKEESRDGRSGYDLGALISVVLA